MQDSVKAAFDQTQRLEVRLAAEMTRARNERIQNTLTALRSSKSDTIVSVGRAGGKEKRPFSFIDVDNGRASAGGVIETKTVFECSVDLGLRLAKRPRNETADLKALRDAVEADCRAARARHPVLSLEIAEEYGLPLVTCQLMIEEIRLPKMYLRVQRGYPRKGGATYGFERPPLGWVGVLCEIHARFRSAIAIAPSSSVGVAVYLDAWAQGATSVCDVAEASSEETAAEGAVGGEEADEAAAEAGGGDGEEEVSFDLPADFAAAATAPIVVL